MGRSWRDRAWVSAAFAIFAATSCTALTGADDLRVDPGAGDASSSSSSASSAGGTSGGTPLVDAAGGSDGADEGGSSGASPCVAPHTFCDDFDGPPLGNNWEYTRQTGGDVDVTDTDHVSPPRSLRVRLREGTGEREALVHKEVELTSGQEVIELGYDIKLTRGSGPFEEIDFGVLIATPAPSGYVNHGITLAERPGASTSLQYFQQDSGGHYDQEEVDCPSLPNGQWAHVVMKLDFSASPAVASISIDDERAVVQLLEGPTPTKIAFEVGVNYMLDANREDEVLVDNVTLDAR